MPPLNTCRTGLAQAILRSVVHVATSLSVLCALTQSAAAQTDPRLAKGARSGAGCDSGR
jgi:hypothetical protein